MKKPLPSVALVYCWDAQKKLGKIGAICYLVLNRSAEMHRKKYEIFGILWKWESWNDCERMHRDGPGAYNVKPGAYDVEPGPYDVKSGASVLGGVPRKSLGFDGFVRKRGGL